MLYELSRIILPTSQYLDNSNLFFNKSISSCKNGCSLEETYIYKFNTWMNIFPAKKYFNYSVINDLHLEIKTSNVFEILIYGFNYNESNYNEELIYQGELDGNIEHNIQINNFQKYENIYFTIVTSSKELNLEKAIWTTSTEPIRKSKLALITCTFKREDYVYKNINLFKNFINNNINLRERIKLYVVDNGRTINSEIQDDNVKLFPNKNAGGAGGFTRGIIEAKNSNEKFTRILLMDDDVEVFPETFYRTLILCDYLKDEYKNSFVHGAMLNMYKKNMFFESTAIKTDNWCYSYHGELDICKPQNIAVTNYTPEAIFKNIDKKVSSAWWYCCFSMDSIINKGLPLPVFFRCDDLEWSWRNFGEHHIAMNGISVWHAPFEWRVSKPVEYYFSKRNIIFINMLHTENYKKTMLKMLKNDFLHLIKTYDYTSCEIYLKMLEDLLCGSSSFEKDPEELLSEIFKYTKNDNILDIEEPINVKSLKKRYNKFKIQKKHYKRYIYKFKRVLFKLTNNSKLLPIFLFKSKKNIWSSAPSEEFMFCKKLNLYNLGTNKVEVRYYDSKKIKKLEKDFSIKLKKIDKNYDAIEKNLKKSAQKFIKEDFWIKYLGLI